MITHIHGMSGKAYQNWKETGSKDSNEQSSPWHCSTNDGYTYLWSLSKSEEECEDTLQYTKERAFESAQIQAAIDGSDYIYLLAMALTEDQYEEDTSCPGMSHCDRTPEENLTPANIKTIWRLEANPYLAPFILSCVSDSPLFNKYALPGKLLAASEVIRDSGVYLDYEVTGYPYGTEEELLTTNY